MSDRLRIFVPSAAGVLTDRLGHGEGLIACHVLTQLAARGHELVVVARAADLAVVPRFEVRVIGRSSRFESVEPLAYARRVTRLYRELGPFDVAHWLFPGEDDELLWAPPPGVRYVVGPRPQPWPDGSRTRPRRPGDLIRRAAKPLIARAHERALQRADTILVQTPRARELVPAHHRRKVVDVPLGVDTEQFSAAPVPPAPLVAYVGRLDHTKRVHLLLDAFREVKRRIPDAEIVIAGDGPDRAALERAAGHGVRFFGAVPHDRVAPIFRDAALAVMPSPGEPFGMSILEAMATGRAVVAVDDAGPAVLVDRERGGRLVPPDDRDALADALAGLLDDHTALVAAGAFNRARVEQEYSLTQMVDRIESVYRSLRQDAG
jgi:glycosyltransferase involved in cell wall biosynthesis